MQVQTRGAQSLICVQDFEGPKWCEPSVREAFPHCSRTFLVPRGETPYGWFERRSLLSRYASAELLNGPARTRWGEGSSLQDRSVLGVSERTIARLRGFHRHFGATGFTL
jgi:hypothetical protein